MDDCGPEVNGTRREMNATRRSDDGCGIFTSYARHDGGRRASRKFLQPHECMPALPVNAKDAVWVQRGLPTTASILPNQGRGITITPRHGALCKNHHAGMCDATFTPATTDWQCTPSPRRPGIVFFFPSHLLPSPLLCFSLPPTPTSDLGSHIIGTRRSLAMRRSAMQANGCTPRPTAPHLRLHLSLPPYLEVHAHERSPLRAAPLHAAEPSQQRHQRRLHHTTPGHLPRPHRHQRLGTATATGDGRRRRGGRRVSRHHPTPVAPPAAFGGLRRRHRGRVRAPLFDPPRRFPSVVGGGPGGRRGSSGRCGGGRGGGGWEGGRGCSRLVPGAQRGRGWGRREDDSAHRKATVGALFDVRAGVVLKNGRSRKGGRGGGVKKENIYI